MRILVNALPAHGTRSGVGHYTAELLRCLALRVHDDEVLVARPRSWVAGLRRNGSARQGAAPSWKRRVASWIKPLGRWLLSKHFTLIARLGRFDLYHEPNYIPAPCSIPTVATIHDLSVLLHPEWHPADRVRWFERNFARMRDQCVHYLTVSDAVRREIVQTLGVPASRVTRTYNGVRPWLRPMSSAEIQPALHALRLPASYVLHVGTIEPRKNLDTLLKAYCDLPASLREAYPLVLAGGWGWKADAVARYFDEVARHNGVLQLGYVPEESLGALYNGARVLVFPSLYEGFGLPTVEMMACSGAVLASTADAVAEVAGGLAPLIAPHDVQGWRDALARVLTDDDHWNLIRRGAVEHARPFTWDRCAEETLRVYREVANSNFDCAGSPVGLRMAG